MMDAPRRVSVAQRVAQPVAQRVAQPVAQPFRAAPIIGRPEGLRYVVLAVVLATVACDRAP